MDVSIIITCYNEENNIGDCLNSLIRQNYTGGEYEIVVADGASTDNTQCIVGEYIRNHSNIRLVVEPGKGTASGRNAGIKASCYDFIAFIDADCTAPENWLSILVDAYKIMSSKDDTVIAVGGTNIPPEESSSFLRAIGIALDSFSGSFNSIQGRQFKKPLYVPSLSNLNIFYRKQPIVEIGYYDESLLSEAEDADLNFRLLSAGHRFVYIPDSYVLHKMRPTPKTWLKNMFRYGKGRARLLKRHPRMWSISFVLPILFALGILSIAFAPFFKIFYLSTLYFPAIGLFSLFQSIKKRHPTLALHVMVVYLIQHFGYAAGEVYGLLNPQVK